MSEANRRSYGTGSLYIRTDSTGRERWDGRWRVGDRRLQRSIGPKRVPGTRHGLTRTQAERKLRRLIDTDLGEPLVPLSIEDAGTQLISRLEALGRKPTTISTYRSLLRTHLTLLGDNPLDRLQLHDVER